MTERPILFSAPMIRALLAGTKTQTRRVMSEKHRWHFIEASGDLDLCPYGKPVDQLWVRETHAPRADCTVSWEKSLELGLSRMQPGEVCYQATTTEKDWVTRWRPSIHMPRWASRIQLEVTDVRVERLQHINEDDAKAEGVDEWGRGALSPESQDADPSEKFRWLWNSINGPYSWSANPWVWCLSFRRLNPA